MFYYSTVGKSEVFSSDDIVFTITRYNKSKWNFLISLVMVVLYAFFSFWYWYWFASLVEHGLLIHFYFFSFWNWGWLNSLSCLHSANSFAIFCLWYWDWVASLFVLDSECSFAHFAFFSLDSSLSFALPLFSYHWKANVQFLDSHEHYAGQVHHLWQRHL